jgi:hypothetical protein
MFLVRQRHGWNTSNGIDVVDISAPVAASMQGPLIVSIRGTKSVIVVSPSGLQMNTCLPGPPFLTAAA